ncbi:slipin family protein [Actinopolymorpha rutila]|uniref:Regulator of protease activity HflC (Stomatin/prohibitin superfamily) n=1 Tax=Actinopolymorpha rutila TaxID=446787 RepID=A0A852ZJR1_9ACTN|nr:slipin family protein [Actinopolymorpha rutila]NYH92138.1 regulator of protease activity HflC (stomatin/prohibitin superfamily) [Actinopolymorpha rutila]
MVVAIVLVLAIVLIAFFASARVVRQIERGVVFRLGQVLAPPRQPGFTMIIPFVDRMRKVNIQVATMPVPAQEGITRDNVTVRVDAVVYFNVDDPIRAIVNVQDYDFAVSQVAQTSLRSIIGKSELDDLLCNRERLNEGLALMIDSPSVGWGITIDRVEIKDVALPETMKRSMSRQAEAERERRSRIITADGEFQASKKLASAAKEMADTPAALQLRLLQTIVEVAAEKNSTVVLPFPVELLRFLDTAAGGLVQQLSTATTGTRTRDSGPAEVESAPSGPAGVEPADAESAELEAGGPEPSEPARPALPHQTRSDEAGQHTHR